MICSCDIRLLAVQAFDRRALATALRPALALSLVTASLLVPIALPSGSVVINAGACARPRQARPQAGGSRSHAGIRPRRRRRGAAHAARPVRRLGRLCGDAERPQGVLLHIAKPKTSQTNPAGRKRDQAYVFISDRPTENVRNEVSVIIGYPFKPSTHAQHPDGADKFAMYTLNDGAWIKNVAEEARMVDSMRKGSDLTVKGVSGHGTEIDRPVFAQGPEPGDRPRRARVQVGTTRALHCRRGLYLS